MEELTECEKQILRLIADGMKRKEIAAALYISERTLSNHLQHIIPYILIYFTETNYTF